MAPRTTRPTDANTDRGRNRRDPAGRDEDPTAATTRPRSQHDSRYGLMTRYVAVSRFGRSARPTDRPARTMPTRTTTLKSLFAAVATIVAGSALVVMGAPADPVNADDAPWTLPVRPPPCSESEALAGDVADCLLYFYSDPADDGFGAPPAPGVGPGWTWQGYTYSGSPALEEWESRYIRPNTESVAGFGPGYFETHVDTQVLFEGFLDEIVARGYDIRHASAYSFRCTSGSGGWSCPSGNVSGLSLHAWGLAVDMNSDKNPIRSYSSIDGRTACATPIETDMPQWVIQTAEKWGLYWGGYGWSSGCIDTTTPRSSVFRDPPHFEFRGTPEMAQAIARFNLGDEFAAACFAVVDDDGEDIERCNATARPEPGWRLPVTPDAPEGATRRDRQPRRHRFHVTGSRDARGLRATQRRS